MGGKPGLRPIHISLPFILPAPFVKSLDEHESEDTLTDAYIQPPDVIFFAGPECVHTQMYAVCVMGFDDGWGGWFLERMNAIGLPNGCLLPLFR
mmetsp:Transcript_52648/g.132327  ORF Transcript_52648/g.132327 Transcript_52648/m.132327 type:complete len:94 (+) Transcript_52648:317-598(+)